MAKPEDIKKKQPKKTDAAPTIVKSVDQKDALIKELSGLGCTARNESGVIMVLVDNPDDVKDTKDMLDTYFEVKDYHSSYGIRYAKVL